MRVAWLALLLTSGEDYFPLHEGARWTYVIEEGEAAREIVAEVGGARTIGRSGWVELSNFLGYEKCYVKASETGVEFRLEESDDEPALTLLRLPAKAGEVWSGKLGGDDLKFIAGGETDVETAAGRRRALHVAFEAESAEKHRGHPATRGDLWFAAGLGLVKAQVTKDLDCHSGETRVYLLKP